MSKVKSGSTLPEKVDFDNYASKYEIALEKHLGFFGEENSFFAEYKIKIVKELLKDSEPLRILEFGCGIGRNLKYLIKYFPGSEILGCDISKASLDIAEKENPSVKFFLLSEDEIKNHYGKYDLVFVSCVFHHIAPPERKKAMSDIYSMMNKGSSVIIFEHNPYNPVTRHIVNTCEWDTDAILLKMGESAGLLKNSGFEVAEKYYTLFLPAVIEFLRPAEQFLKKLPAGGQYYVRGIKKS